MNISKKLLLLTLFFIAPLITIIFSLLGLFIKKLIKFKSI